MMAWENESESIEVLANWVRDARQRTLDLVADLSDEQLMGPRLATINPLIWEIGHAAWFQEKWVLRHSAGRSPILTEGARLYDSIAIEHPVRWDLPLLSRADTLNYICRVRDDVLEELVRETPRDELIYFLKYSVFHEDMHTEAFTYTRQTLGYPPPRFSDAPMESEQTSAAVESIDRANCAGDVVIPGGCFTFGARRDSPFVFDNEKWAHEVEVAPFAIARCAVTQSEYAAFVEDGGYRRLELWSEAGRVWLAKTLAEHPVYWKKADDGTWLRRDFDRWVAIEPHRPVLHVNWHEASAFCNWAERRLPTEMEWEVAASATRSDQADRLWDGKRTYPWGNSAPTPAHANFDWQTMGAVDVGDIAAGDSAFGCRQMLGNVWEWTASDLLPYPGFIADEYKEYSQSCFHECKVLRGGCWASRSRMLRNTWRNFYRPDRRDIWAGFRTCARSL